jgi:hypothetical protein
MTHITPEANNAIEEFLKTTLPEQFENGKMKDIDGETIGKLFKLIVQKAWKGKGEWIDANDFNTWEKEIPSYGLAPEVAYYLYEVIKAGVECRKLYQQTQLELITPCEMFPEIANNQQTMRENRADTKMENNETYGQFFEKLDGLIASGRVQYQEYIYNGHTNPEIAINNLSLDDDHTHFAIRKDAMRVPADWKESKYKDRKNDYRSQLSYNKYFFLWEQFDAPLIYKNTIDNKSEKFLTQFKADVTDQWYGWAITWVELEVMKQLLPEYKNNKDALIMAWVYVGRIPLRNRERKITETINPDTWYINIEWWSRPYRCANTNDRGQSRLNNNDYNNDVGSAVIPSRSW